MFDIRVNSVLVFFIVLISAFSIKVNAQTDALNSSNSGQQIHKSHSRLHFNFGSSFASVQLNPLPPYNKPQAVEVNLEFASFTQDAIGKHLKVVIESPDGQATTIFDQSVIAPAAERWSTKVPMGAFNQDGKHLLHVYIDQEYQRSLDVQVFDNPYGRSLGYATTAWFDPGGMMTGVYGRSVNPNYTKPEGEIYEEHIKAVVQNMFDVGIRTVVFSYVEYGGVIYYDNSQSYVTQEHYNFWDVDGGFQNNPAANKLHYTPKHWTEYTFFPKARDDADILKALLEKADELGMSVILGLGRDGDDLLINDIYHWSKPGATPPLISQNGGQVVSDLMMNWRLNRVRVLEAYKALDLLAIYGLHESFVGFYISHEAHDIISAIQHLYGPISDSLKYLSPSRLVVVGPANDPFRLPGDRTTAMPALMAKSNVDIFAWQDSVGTGVTPSNPNDPKSPLIATFEPERTIPYLFNQYSGLRGWVDLANANSERTGLKTLWSVTEAWEMDKLGGPNYTGAFPAKYSRLQQQFYPAALNVDAISLYEFSVNFQAKSDPLLLLSNPAPGGTCGSSHPDARCEDFRKRSENLLACYANAVGVTKFDFPEADCN